MPLSTSTSQRPMSPNVSQVRRLVGHSGRLTSPAAEGADMNREDYVSRRQAAKLLGITPPSLDRLAKLHGLKIRQVPGHRRKWFVRAEVEALAARAETASSL